MKGNKIMKIGEFAKAVGTRISILRHYDREGLLRPIFVDKFTGYRYYDESQAEQYRQIYELKEAGFTLNEIKEIISNSTEIEDIFIRKKSELEQTLHNLQHLLQMHYLIHEYLLYFLFQFQVFLM